MQQKMNIPKYAFCILLLCIYVHLIREPIFMTCSLLVYLEMNNKTSVHSAINS